MCYHREVIYDSGEIKAIYQPADSDFVVFSFNGMGFSETGSRFYGDLFFGKRGIAAVGLVDTKSTWFRDPRVAAAIAAIAAYKPLQNGQRRLTYGASMGGYGALKYGRVLQAHAALAVGPQTSIDPHRVGSFDRRYRRFFDPDLHKQMDVVETDLCSHNFVFFDPASPHDRRHASMLPRVQPVVSPFIGHPGIVFFTQLRLIQEIFPIAAGDRPDAKRFRQLVRSRRQNSADYWFNRAKYQRRRQPPVPEQTVLYAFREALRLNRSVAEHADTLKFKVGYADALLDAGQHVEARPLLETLWEIRERGYSIPGLFDLLTKAQEFERARIIADNQARSDANHPEAVLEKARLLFVSGDVPGANAAADAARALANHNPMAWRNLRWLYQRLGREADAAAANAMLTSINSGRSDSTRES